MKIAHRHLMWCEVARTIYKAWATKAKEKWSSQINDWALYQNIHKNWKAQLKTHWMLIQLNEMWKRGENIM